MTKSPTIERFTTETVDDYSVFEALHAAAFKPLDEAPWDAHAFRQLVESPGMEIWLASMDEKPCGYILIRAVCDEAELISIAVDPAIHRSGVGRHMLACVVAHLQRRGTGKLFLEVRNDNAAAVQFYESHGFEKIGERPGYYQTLSGNRIDALCLALPVNEKNSSK